MTSGISGGTGINLTAVGPVQCTVDLAGELAQARASGQHAGRGSVPSSSRPASTSTENAGHPDAGHASSAGSVVASQVRSSSKAPAGSAHASGVAR